MARFSDRKGAGDPYVYFVQIDTGPIKIGFSTHLVTRLESINTANPGEWRLLWLEPGGSGSEMGWHRKFAAHRIAREWFRPADEIMRELAALRKKSEGWDQMQRIHLGDTEAHEQWNAPWFIMEAWWLPYVTPNHTEANHD